mgnify:CR=1 FL=1
MNQVNNSIPSSGTKRFVYLDIAKGLAIVSIVLLHFATGFIPPIVNVFISSYMISMFYVTSGWVNAMQPRQLPFREFLRKRWHQLGVPYLAWTLIILAFDMILWAFGYYNTYFIAREIYKSIVLRGIGTLWFLPALFGAEMLWWWTRNRYPRLRCLIISVSVALFIWLYGIILEPRDTLAMSIIEAPFRVLYSIATAWLGVAAGFCFHRYVLKWIQARHKIVALVAGLLIMLAGWYCALCPPIPLFWSFGAPLLEPIGLILIIMSIETSPLLRYFNYWGRNSMALMVTHFSILIVLCDIAVWLIWGHPMRGGWIALSLFGLTMIIEYFLAEWLSRKYPKILGIRRHKESSSIDKKV